MISKKYVILTGILAVICTLTGFSLGLREFREKKDRVTEVNAAETKILETTKAVEETESVTVGVVQDKITPSTKIVYEYYYPEDGVTEKREESPPYYMVGLTREDMISSYENWDIVSFSENTVVMRMEIPGSSTERYIIGEYQGLLAVYREEAKDGIVLRELTNIPVASLSYEEQESLKKGIYVFGEENLLKALSDYGS